MKYSGSPENERIIEGPDTHEAAQAVTPGEVECYPVSTAVNDSHHEGVDLIGRVREAFA
jgi:hypothetical protein